MFAVCRRGLPWSAPTLPEFRIICSVILLRRIHAHCMDAEEPLLPEHFAGDVGGVMGAHLTRSASVGFLLALDSLPSP